MEVNIKREVDKVPLKDVPQGECFRFPTTPDKRVIYIRGREKMSNRNFIPHTNLASGATLFSPKDILVQPVKAEVFIHE